jgi:hypothetical protein
MRVRKVTWHHHWYSVAKVYRIYAESTREMHQSTMMRYGGSIAMLSCTMIQASGSSKQKAGRLQSAFVLLSPLHGSITTTTRIGSSRQCSVPISRGSLWMILIIWSLLHTSPCRVNELHIEKLCRIAYTSNSYLAASLNEILPVQYCKAA